MRTLVTLSLVVVAVGCANTRDLRGRYPSSSSSSSSSSLGGSSVESYGSAPTTTIYSGTPSGRPEPARSSPSLVPATAPKSAAAPQAHPEATDGPWEVPPEERSLAKESSTPSSEKAGTPPSAQAKAAEPEKSAGDPGKTAGDQGNSKREVAITAAIRRELVRSTTLSFAAKNAKVITTGTTVTLRGEVRSDVERAEIERVARAAEGVAEVDNRLEVKK
jgi:hyperosmotically inducible periplasmic protein